MAEITHQGKTIQTRGRLPAIGSRAPDFRLTRTDLTDVSLASYGGRRKILNIVLSLDTGVCAASARRFDSEAADLQNVVVLTISNDLPFAQNRFCQAEGIRTMVTLSQMRAGSSAPPTAWRSSTVRSPVCSPGPSSFSTSTTRSSIPSKCRRSRRSRRTSGRSLRR